jgi:antitoxin VapB
MAGGLRYFRFYPLRGRKPTAFAFPETASVPAGGARRHLRILDMIYIMVYIKFRGKYMQTARLFINGRSQAVRLPKEYQFKGEDVYIQKIGDAVIIFPMDKEWETFLHGLNNFSDDYFSEERDQGKNQEREEI